MAEKQVFRIPKTIKDRAEKAVDAAVFARGVLDATAPGARYDVRGVGGVSLGEDNLMLIHDGSQQGEKVYFDISKLLAGVLAGDVMPEGRGYDMVAYYPRVEFVPRGAPIAHRTALIMDFDDARKIVQCCVMASESSRDQLAIALSHCLEGPGPLRDKLSPDGYAPVAPLWARFL